MRDAGFGWLVPYPKSGNTWMRMMLASLLSGGTAIDINRAAAESTTIATFAELDEFLGVESSELTAGEIAEARPALHAEMLACSRTRLLLRKVHDRFWMTATGRPAFSGAVSRGAVYLIRDPRDVAVSYAHHRGWTADRIIDTMRDPAAELSRVDASGPRQLPQPLGSWSTHVASWTQQREVPVLVLRYEDLKQDPHAGLRAAAELFGIAASEAQIAAAVSAARFEVLRAQEDAAGFREHRPGSTSPFFRRGVVGDGQRFLSPEQQERIVQDHRETMERFHYLA